MNARTIANRLLEADIEPKDFLDDVFQANREKQLALFPEELRGLFEYADDEFLMAMGDPDKSAAWASDTLEDPEWWPSYQGDNDVYPWSKFAYYTEFEVHADDTLTIQVVSMDSDGDRNIIEGDVYSPEKRDFLRKEYSRVNWLSALVEYDQWVAEHGQDPLQFFSPLPPKTQQVRWWVEVLRQGEGVRFSRARRQDSKQAIVQPARLPKEVHDYLTLDAQDPQNRTMNISWNDLIAAQETAEFDQNRAMLVFTLETSQSDPKAEADHLRKIATASARKHQQEISRTDPNESFVVP